MKPLKNFKIINASGERINFSSKKVANSLRKAGANDQVIQEVQGKINGELYEGISTREIYNRAFHLLKKKNELLASRYKLKKAIYELGPTGYPFEKFVAAVLKNSGYEISVGKIIHGQCVDHEVDVIAKKNDKTILIECKFHSEQGRYCNVKIPLYIHARFDDIRNGTKNKDSIFSEGWVVTNTRFTKDAIEYGHCTGLYLLSWDTPAGKGLKDLIDHTGLYPITVTSLLAKREKEFLLSRDIVLCKEILENDYLLDHLDVSETRKRKILKEMNRLCSKSDDHEK